ncbi:MAG: hypothetical protein FWF55_08640, partial [Treponema sp.]|nr:hypothetical protein [Treponema sp.]
GAFNNVTGVTFVATGPARAQTDGGDATVGTVYGYTGGTNPNSVTTPTTPGGTITIPSAIASQKTGTFTAGSSGNITFTNNSFGGNVNQTATIPDTPILNNPNDPANPLLRHDRYFIIKVFDSTQAGLTEDQQLAHVALINVDVNNGDSVTPVIYVAPFGQEYVLSNATGAVIESNASRVLGPVPAYTRNVVTTGLDGAGTKKGYVQYASHSNNGSYPNTTNANVSGMVIFKGKAADNGRIASIQAQIAGYNSGNWFEIAAWNAGTNTLAPSNSAVTIDTMRSSDANARGFDAEDNSLTLDYNHVVNWSFAWDTSTVTGVTATGTTVSFRVTDANNNTSVATTDAPYRSQTAVNIVPYITGIRSSLPSQFDRSAANGWYPVREGQSITINGFNLANGATKPTVNVGGTLNADGTITFPNPNTNGVNIDANRVSTPTSTRQLTVVIDNDNDSTNANGVNSGVLTLVVNGITSFNNRNNNSAALTNRVDGTGAIVQRYNREPTVTNTILTDNRGLYVWNTGALVNSNILSSPKMRMSDNATRYTSFGAYIYSATTGNSSVKVITNNTQLNANGEPQRGTNTTANPGTNEGSVMFYNNRFVNFGFGLTPQGEWGVAATNMTSTGATYTFAYNTLGLGSVAGASNNNGNRRLIMMAGADPDRVKYPSVAVRRPIAGTEPTNAASATRTVLAYYDSRNFSATMNGNNTVVSAANHPVLLHYGFFYNVNNGTNDTGYISGNANNTATGGQFPAQRAGNGNFNTATPPVAQNAIYNTTSDLLNNYGTIPDPNLVVADDTQKARGGEYVAAGLLSNGRAVVAWYDESIQSLWFSYGVNTPTTANGNPIAPAQTMTDWQNNAVIIKGSAGTHVDLAVDGGDNVHLAYVNPVDGGLWYSYIPYSGGVPNSKADSSNNSLVNSAVRTVRVDTYLSVGTKLMLNVREQGTGNYVPYITYIHNAFAETTNSVRVAWRNTTQANLAHGTDDDNAFTGAWEVMTVPAQTIPDTNEYVSNGVPGNAPNNNWVPGNSWSSLRAPGVGINNTILVGYMTKSWYEGAILKYNIRNAGVINVNQ